MSLKCTVRCCVAAVVCLALLACGGGGSGTPQADQPDRFPTVVTDTWPTGATVDLTTDNYNPFAAGDSWTYDAYDTGLGEFTGEVTVRVLSGPDAQGVYEVETTDSSGGASSVTRYRKTAEGLVNLAPLAPALTPRAASIVGPLLVMPEPMTTMGLERTSLRRGSWGQDEDGDGIFDGFELIYRQTFGGLIQAVGANPPEPPMAVVNSLTTLTLLTTRAGYVGSTVTLTQTSKLAPGLGPIQVSAMVTNPLQPVIEQQQILTLNAATIGGRRMPTDPARVFATSIHVGQVYDALRSRFLIALPSGQTHGPLLLALDTDAMFTSVVKILDAEPLAMAISSDGQSIHVSTTDGAVVRYGLADLQESGRVALPNSMCAWRLVASPTESTVLLAHLRSCGGFSSVEETVLIRNLAIAGTPLRIDRFLHAFSTDGTMVYARTNSASRPSPGFERYDVTAGGLAYRDFVAAVPAFTEPGIDLEARNGRIRLGDVVLDEQSFVQVGTLANTRAPCAAVGADARWICRPRVEASWMLNSMSVFDGATLARQADVDYEFKFAAFSTSQLDTVFLTRGKPGEILMGQAFMQSNTPMSTYHIIRSSSLP